MIQVKIFVGVTVLFTGNPATRAAKEAVETAIRQAAPQSGVEAVKLQNAGVQSLLYSVADAELPLWERLVKFFNDPASLKKWGTRFVIGGTALGVLGIALSPASMGGSVAVGLVGGFIVLIGMGLTWYGDTLSEAEQRHAAHKQTAAQFDTGQRVRVICLLPTEEVYKALQTLCKEYERLELASQEEHKRVVNNEESLLVLYTEQLTTRIADFRLRHQPAVEGNVLAIHMVESVPQPLYTVGEDLRCVEWTMWDVQEGHRGQASRCMNCGQCTESRVKIQPFIVLCCRVRPNDFQS